MARRMENTCTRCANGTGVVAAVAIIASRSFRRESRSVDSSVDGGGMRFSVEVFGARWAAGGLEVASFERLKGRDASAASRSFP